MKFHHLLILLAFTIGLLSCRNKHFDESVENMNKGEISLYADESYKGIVDELVKSYENVYPEATIHVTYASENEVVNAMMSGKTHMMITGRKLSAPEMKAIERANDMKPQVHPVATEAVAIISSANNPDSVFDFDEFMTLKNGHASDNYVNRKYVFVKGQTSFVNQVTGNATENLTNMFSLENPDTLINYISQTNDSYGFISFALISDTDNPATGEILKKIKVLQLVQRDSADMRQTYELSQSAIAANTYPLQRSVYVVKGNMDQPLGTGFVNFMYRSKASRIFLKAGLIPAVMPERQLLIKE